MGISLTNVKRAHEVFNQLKESVLPDLRINSWPEDMAEWTEKERESPHTNQVYGFDKKSDNSWENLYFFVENPSKELLEKFEQLKSKVGNSSMCSEYKRNKKLWIIGWF